MSIKVHKEPCLPSWGSTHELFHIPSGRSAGHSARVQWKRPGLHHLKSPSLMVANQTIAHVPPAGYEPEAELVRDPMYNHVTDTRSRRAIHELHYNPSKYRAVPLIRMLYLLRSVQHPVHPAKAGYDSFKRTGLLRRLGMRCSDRNVVNVREALTTPRRRTTLVTRASPVSSTSPSGFSHPVYCLPCLWAPY